MRPLMFRWYAWWWWRVRTHTHSTQNHTHSTTMGRAFVMRVARRRVAFNACVINRMSLLPVDIICFHIFTTPTYIHLRSKRIAGYTCHRIIINMPGAYRSDAVTLRSDQYNGALLYICTYTHTSRHHNEATNTIDLRLYSGEKREGGNMAWSTVSCKTPP